MTVLQVKINEGDLRERTLWLSVWDNNKLSRNTFLGEVRLKMSSVTFAETGLREIPLFDLVSLKSQQMYSRAIVSIIPC